MSEPSEVKIEISCLSFQDVLDKINEVLPGVPFEDIAVEYSHEQFRCFGYDQYDPTDWKDYIILRKTK